MTLDEIDSGLPNGFHDAEVSQLTVDFLQKTMTLDLELWIGSMSLPLNAGRETYRAAKLELCGLAYFAVGPPDPKSLSQNTKLQSQQEIRTTESRRFSPHPSPLPKGEGTFGIGSKYPYDNPGAITVDLCDVEDGSNLPPIQSGMFASRFFVNEWNAFIIVSASEAVLTWTGEPHNCFAHNGVA